MLVVSGFEAMSEPLYLFLNLAALACILPHGEASRGTLAFITGGLLFGFATLARPVGLYVPLVCAALMLMGGMMTGSLRTTGGRAFILVVASLLPVAPWIVRNAVVFSHPRLTTADSIMLVYFFGGGAYQVEHDLTLTEAQQRISREYGLEPPEVTNNHWVSKKPVAQIDRELRAAIRPILIRYPSSLAISAATGVVKASVSHNVPLYAYMTGRHWQAPGTGGLLRAEPAAYQRLLSNAPDLIGMFAAQVLSPLVVWALALWGLIVGLRNNTTRPACLLVGGLLAYLLFTVAIVGMEAYWRSRSPHLPLLAMLAGVGLAAAWKTCSRTPAYVD
jgi:4-amino-4-deoxy-L-arabinose transferase-like glycosyltransferase